MPLLEPKPQALRPSGRRTTSVDRVPDRLAGGTPEPLRGDLTALLGAAKVLWKVSDLVRYASDASPYRFVPQVVVVAQDIDDISAVLSYAHGKGREVVFRAAGTSLNGQAQGEDILVDVRRHWAGVEVLDDGARVRVRPGTTVARVNAALARHGRVVERVADPCIECGFCEPTCPSRDLTTTPRQRIVLRREVMRQSNGSPVQEALLDAYGYDAVDTCAGDSTCALDCPVGIDTGALMKGFRHLRHSPREERVAALTARHFTAVEASARLAVGAARAIGDRLGGRALARVTGLARKAVRPDLLPGWLPETPGAAPVLPRTRRVGASAVYYPACVNRIFGEPQGHRSPSLPQAVVALATRAGKPVWIPEDVAGTCCATIWHSKGYELGNAVMANRIVEAAWGWTAGGTLPLVVDASSCALGIAHEVVPYLSTDNWELHAALTVVDSVVWAAEELLPHLTVVRRARSAVLHPTCSTRHLDDEAQLRAVAGACAEEVVVPDDAGCCAFAGDRGMLHQELTGAATAREAAEVTDRHFDAHLSANRMCEIGMERATGLPYVSVLLELERATRPGPEYLRRS
ncbi:FAD-binding and (Fe-S)-binding domain-containing protein [Streptomyces sp. NPDC058301]|uniref:FAD-binding and (Fe-S)-binding domain-containing protein n=1 Tax=Streptomyces sp. NPDC058301 TaxID=3346436 RepID=UPI0036ECF12D